MFLNHSAAVRRSTMSDRLTFVKDLVAAGANACAINKKKTKNALHYLRRVTSVVTQEPAEACGSEHGNSSTGRHLVLLYSNCPGHVASKLSGSQGCSKM